MELTKPEPSRSDEQTVDVSIILPSLNEEKTIGEVIDKAKKTLEASGYTYEIIVSDNSTDATPRIASEKGALVVHPDRLGYGYAYLYALRFARGKFIVFADADGTYDLSETPKLVEPLVKGEADVVLGTRLKGKIMPGAMPWLHRYIGNPILTYTLNKFYGTRVSDAHTGFRAMTREALQRLSLESSGMEFASELLVKAAYAGLRIREVPITYYPRAEGTRSKLRSLRDGWRHLKLLLLLAPKFLYYLPGAVMLAAGAALMLAALLRANLGYSPGLHSAMLGGALAVLGNTAVAMGLIADLHLAKMLGRPTSRITKALARHLSVERALAAGTLMVAAGLTYAAYLFLEWVESGYRYLPVRGENAVALTLIVFGTQIFLHAMAAYLISWER
ncbi:glycosyltransferase family 2 protein [Infirmifilum sp.]|uniref:glycosyltransferase family 2 protein n=1 Tax=Infirmifilum sp. TaxID=2856575 RepID=UPI003D095D3C